MTYNDEKHRENADIRIF